MIDQETLNIEGKVVRFNVARHGQPNGVELDSGDVMHNRPNEHSGAVPNIYSASHEGLLKTPAVLP